MHAIRRLLPVSLIALSSAYGQAPTDSQLPPGVPAAPAPVIRPVVPPLPGEQLPDNGGGAPAVNAANVPLADRKITEPIIEPKLTGNELAGKYRAFTGRRVVVSAAAAAAEFAFTQDASPADPLTYAEAAKLLKMAALIEGFVFVPAENGVEKLMFSSASAGPRQEGIEIYNQNDVLPNEDRVICYVMSLEYLKPEEAQRVFTTIIGSFGSYASIAPIPNASAVIITDKTSLIRKLIELKAEVDKPIADVKTEFIKVQYADVTELAETLNQMLSSQKQTQQTAGVQRTDTAPVANPGAAIPSGGSRSGAGSSDSVPVQLVPDSRTNRIFVMGCESDVKFVKGLISEFDTQTSEKSFFRRKLNFLTAGEFLPIAGDALKRAFSSNSQGGASGGGPGSTGANFGGQGAASRGGASGGSSGRSGSSGGRSGGQSTGGSSSFGGGSGSGSGSSTDVGSLSDPEVSTAPTSLLVGRTLLVADNITNSVIVQGPPASVEIIQKLLSEVDVRADQVMISAVFGQLDLKDNLDYGVNIIRSLNAASLAKGGSGIGGGNVNGGSTPNPLGNSTTVGGVTTVTGGLLDPAGYARNFSNGGLNVYGFLSNQFNVYINALQATGNFSVLSRPTIYIANNKKGLISSGQKIAVPTTSFNGGSTGSSTNIEYQEVVLKLEVVPLINSDKEVTLNIILKSDEPGASQTVGTLTVPSIITRSMTTTVTVPNNQTVALGGLVVTRDGDAVSGIPILSSIPGIGKLFSTTSKKKNKSELMIFIQPSIVRTADNLDQVQSDMGRRYKVAPSLMRFADGPAVIPPPDGIVPTNEKASDYSSSGRGNAARGSAVEAEPSAPRKSTKRLGHPGH